MIEFACPACGQNFAVADHHVGKKSKCPKCGELVLVPSRTHAPKIIPSPIQHRPPEAPVREIVREIHYHSADPQEVNVDVHLTQPSSAATSLGIASMALGIVGLGTCCLPWLSFFFLGIGLVLGIVGLVAASSNNWNGIGYSIAGITFCSIVVIPIAIMAIFAVSLIGGAAQMAHTSSRPAMPPPPGPNNPMLNPPIAQQPFQPQPFQQQPFQQPPSQAVVRPAPTPKPTPQAAMPIQQQAPTQMPATPPPAATPAKPTNLISATKPFQVGNLTVSIDDAMIGKVVLLGSSGRKKTNNDHFQIVVRITNPTRNNLAYAPWAATPALAPSLMDDLGNTYKLADFGLVSQVAGQLTAPIVPLPAGAIRTDVIVFMAPDPGAKEFYLTLPATNLGGQGEVSVVIARKWVRIPQTIPTK